MTLYSKLELLKARYAEGLDDEVEDVKDFTAQELEQLSKEYPDHREDLERLARLVLRAKYSDDVDDEGIAEAELDSMINRLT